MQINQLCPSHTEAQADVQVDKITQKKTRAKEKKQIQLKFKDFQLSHQSNVTDAFIIRN